MTLAGGYHVCHRTTNASTYIAMASTLKLPTLCACEPDSAPGVYDGTYPEFFHGFYAGSYGLDIGVIWYQDGRFGINYHTFTNTAAVTDGEFSITTGVGKGDTIELRTYLSGQLLVAQIYKNSNWMHTSQITLTSAAATRFAQGCTINREIAMASNNAANGGIPSDAYFSDTKFSNSTLTTTGGAYVALSSSNSTLLAAYADNRTIDSSRYGRSTGSTNGFVWDQGSCNFR